MERRKSLRNRILLGNPLVLGAGILLASGAGAAIALTAVTTEIPLFLDTVGTAVIAALFGVFPGVLTGLLTNTIAELFHPHHALFISFAPVNMTTGLIVGLLAWRHHLARPGVLGSAVVLVTCASILLGSVTALFVHAGVTATSVDHLVTSLALSGRSLSVAAFLARIPVNLVDKSISLIAAYWVYLWVYGEYQGEG